MSKGYATTDAAPIPRLILSVLFVLSLVFIILVSSVWADTHAPVPTPVIRAPLIETRMATVIVIASVTPTSTLLPWAKTATAKPSPTRGPIVPTATATPSFFGNETTGRVSER